MIKSFQIFFIVGAFWGVAYGQGLESASIEAYPLWSLERGFPAPEEIGQPEVITYVRVNRAVENESQFLHGAAIVYYKQKFYACWANSPINENSGEESVRVKVSTDGGCTWGNVRTIAPDLPGMRRRSHGVFWVHDDRLWFFGANFGGADQPLKEGRIYFAGLQTEAFVLNEKDGDWRSVQVAVEDFWPLDEPAKMKDGNWILGGIDKNFKAAVAVVPKDDILNWQVIKIPQPEKKHYAESSVWVDGKVIQAIMRNQSGKCAAISISKDCGRTWSRARETNYPMAASKPYAGMLTTGQRYLVSNLQNRNYLTIAVSKPQEQCLSKIWMIRRGVSRQPLYKGWGKRPQWSYPYAYEHEGRLYVVYSVGKEDCELAIIPLSCLYCD